MAADKASLTKKDVFRFAPITDQRSVLISALRTQLLQVALMPGLWSQATLAASRRLNKCLETMLLTLPKVQAQLFSRTAQTNNLSAMKAATSPPTSADKLASQVCLSTNE